MKIYLGIDCTETGTQVTVIDEAERVLFEHTSKANDTTIVNDEKILTGCENSLKHFLLKHPDDHFTGIFAGGHSIRHNWDMERMQNILSKLPLVNEETKITVRNSLENALYSGKIFDTGIALVCDQEMIAFGKKGDETFQFGDRHQKEGDPGSACYIGTEAVHYVMELIEHGKELDDFAKEIESQVGFKKVEDFVWVTDYYCGNCLNTSKIALTVLKHADLGNEFARSFLDEAIGEAIKAVQEVSEKLNLKEGKLVIVGLLSENNEYYLNELINRLKGLNKKFDVFTRLITPSLGAALAAKHYH